jgi:integrating conjugative element protein (TIGR03752 family)
MIFTGNTIGDWTLLCVRGQIHSVTYVFGDGTIRTLSSDDQSIQQKSQQSAQASGQANASQNNNRNGHQALGWISDRRGIPCITGSRITNAPQYLGGRFLARAIGAAGEAYARSQTTVNSTPLGGFSTGVTGNPQTYALGSPSAKPKTMMPCLSIPAKRLPSMSTGNCLSILNRMAGNSAMPEKSTATPGRSPPWIKANDRSHAVN